MSKLPSESFIFQRRLLRGLDFYSMKS